MLLEKLFVWLCTGKELVYSYIYARLELHAKSAMCVSVQYAIQRASRVRRKYAKTTTQREKYIISPCTPPGPPASASDP